MVKKTDKGIQLLRKSEINELYDLANLNQADSEDYFYLDNETQKLIDKCRQFETKVYFRPMLDYFRCKPTIFNFSFAEVEADVSYILHRHFDDLELTSVYSVLTTKTKLINRLLDYSGFAVIAEQQLPLLIT